MNQKSHLWVYSSPWNNVEDRDINFGAVKNFHVTFDFAVVPFHICGSTDYRWKHIFSPQLGIHG